MTREKPEILAEYPLSHRLRLALHAVRFRCDGAFSLDGTGYSKYDRPIADDLLAHGEWDGIELEMANNLVRRYRRQLVEMGYDVLMILGIEGDGGSVELPSDTCTRESELDSSKHDIPVTAADAKQSKAAVAGILGPRTGTPLPTSTVSYGKQVSTVERKQTSPVEEPTKRREAVVVDGAGTTVHCSLLTGSAGTGKTFEIRRRLAEDPNYGQMVATTGIAAINLGTVTINSVLGYFDTESMEEAFIKGWIEKKLMEVAEAGAKNFIVDECSMMAKQQLGFLHQGMKQVNERLEWQGKQPMGLILTGDFCQLPPIKADWCFKADCWPDFAANITRLTKCWRQDDQRFVEALALIRKGNGRDGAQLLKGLGVTFAPSPDVGFDGTTIRAKNEDVDTFNFAAQSRLSGQMTRVTAERWGKLRTEWKWDVIKGRRVGNIPPALELKIGSYVMILSNDSPAFTFVNGDCGHIEAFENGVYHIRLKRNDLVVGIGPLIRENMQKAAPSPYHEEHQHEYYKNPSVDDTPFGREYFHVKKRKWVIGGIRYYPIRLAYASTVHKSQGLSLDNVQIDCYNRFFGEPAMAYVALSRARTVAGLRIVGTPELLAERVKVHPEVLQWL